MGSIRLVRSAVEQPAQCFLAVGLRVVGELLPASSRERFDLAGEALFSSATLPLLPASALRSRWLPVTVGVTVAVGTAAIGVSVAALPSDPSEPMFIPSVVSPIALGALVVFLESAVIFVARNRDVYGKRAPMRDQFGSVGLAMIVACLYVGVSLLVLVMAKGTPAS